MNTLGRQNISGCRSLCCRRRWRCGRNARSWVLAAVGNPPNPTALIVGDIQCTVRPNRQPGRAMCRLARLLDRSSETVREHDKGPGSLAVGQWLEHDIVAPLRFRRTVPGSMECNEGAVFIGRWELVTLIDQHVVGRPMGREGRYRPLLLRADAHGLSAIATIFRGEDELFLDVIVIAFRPAEIAALLQLD